MIDSVIFIGAMIIAITQCVKILFPQVKGAITIIIAMLVGALVGIFGPYIGVAAISIAQGILIGLAAVGVHTTVTGVSSTSN